MTVSIRRPSTIVSTSRTLVETYLSQTGVWEDDILTFPVELSTPAMVANSYYFGHPEWGKEYLDHCHQDDEFRSLWNAAMGSWDDKIVVDVCCGPGNLLSSLQGSPRLIVGVDISKGALQMAREFGYIPVLADAHQMPFVSEFADIVTVNAGLHHCDDMERVLAEAARLVRPGGLLVSDRDQQRSSMNFTGISFLLWKLRLLLWRFLKGGMHSDSEKQKWGLATEIHGEHPGDGVVPEMYRRVLEPMGFEVKLYPHNHDVGAVALKGNYGRAERRWRILQRLAGIDPNSPEAAMSLMCVAVKKS